MECKEVFRAIVSLKMYLWVKAKGGKLCNCKIKLTCTYVLHGSFSAYATHTPIYVRGFLKYGRSVPSTNFFIFVAYWAGGITQSTVAISSVVP